MLELPYTYIFYAVKFCACFAFFKKVSCVDIFEPECFFAPTIFLVLNFFVQHIFTMKEIGLIAKPYIFIPLLLLAAAPGPGPKVSSLLSLIFGYFILAIWTPFLNR